MLDLKLHESVFLKSANVQSDDDSSDDTSDDSSDDPSDDSSDIPSVEEVYEIPESRVWKESYQYFTS